VTPAISILTATRNRPANVARLIDSALSTTELPVELLFYLDADDPTLEQSLAIIGEHHPVARELIGPRIVLSRTWNACYDHAAADVVMHCGDDIIFRSRHWAEAVLREFDKVPDRILLVHGRDGIQDDRVATHGFYHRRWVEAVGYFMPPYFSSDWNDMWWTEVADQLGRRVYLPGVFTEHMHPVVGKADMDLTHQERLARHSADDCDARYRELYQQRQADVVKLRGYIAAQAEVPA
jgi:hypothetical protein